MFGHLYGYLANQANHWKPEATAGIGVVASIFPTADSITRVLGALAIVVGIYCSISRELRDQRAERARQAKASGSP